MDRRNYEWPAAETWDGFFTQDKPGGVTQRVPPGLVIGRLASEFVSLVNDQTVQGVKDFVDGLATSSLAAAQSVDFGTAPDALAHVAGRTHWDTQDQTLATDLPGGVTLQHGQEVLALGLNKTGETLANGTVVYCSGSQAYRTTFAKAEANVSAHSLALAVLTQDVADNAQGFGTAFGLVRDFDTSAFTEGAVLYLSTDAGKMTQTRPAAPNVGVRIGLCVRSHPTQGMIFVAIDRFPTIAELSDASISSPTSGQVLVWDGVTWGNESLDTSQVAETASYLYFTEARVRGSALTGYTVGADTALAATDTILAAFGKVQGQLNAKQSALINPVTGTATAGQVALWTSTGVISGDAGLTTGQTGGVTDALAVGNGTLSPVLSVNGASASNASLLLRAAGVTRWSIMRVATSQAFWLRAHDASGVAIDAPIVVSNSGAMTLGGAGRTANFTGDLQAGGSQFLSPGKALNVASALVTALAHGSSGSFLPVASDYLGNVSYRTAAQARGDIGAQATLGYTPVNKAGDTMTGKLVVGGTGVGYTPSIMSDGGYGTGVHDGSMTSGYRTAGFKLEAAFGAHPDRLNMFYLTDDMAGRYFGGYFGFDGSVGATAILQLSASSRTQLVGSRKTGWSTWTGTASRASRATRTTVTASAGYVQAEATAMMQDIQYLMQGLKALIDDLHATAGHGLIGT